MTPLLTVRHLTVALGEYPARTIIQDVSFTVEPLKIVALVGGSGSGKTTTGFSVTQLLAPALKITRGEILFKNEDIAHATPERMEQLRGKDIAMVFQEPLHAFNPVMTVGSQIAEVLRYHTPLSGQAVTRRMAELLEQVGLTEAMRVMKSYPHQLSGGMRQRAMIAQAIAASPSLLIADEPTSSLDVTLQANILELFRRLRDQWKLSMILITHDLGVVAHLADEIVVLQQGRVVEAGPAKQVLAHPRHPYTQQLMETQKV